MILAWKWWWRHAGMVVALSVALCLAMLMPLGLLLVGWLLEKDLIKQGASVPVLLHSRGSELEATLRYIFYQGYTRSTLNYGQYAEMKNKMNGEVIPIYDPVSAQGFQVVGTIVDFFDIKKLKVGEGKMMKRLGDCVVGVEVARRLKLKVNDGLITDSSQVFAVAGQYPLKMRVTGILEKSQGPEDRLVFCSLSTCWLIDGIAHGHQKTSEIEEGQKRIVAGGGVQLYGGVKMFQEVTEENQNSFHFHGEENSFPISAMLIWPQDSKEEALCGSVINQHGSLQQWTRPIDEVKKLLMVFEKYKKIFLIIFIVLSLAVLMMVCLFLKVYLKQQGQFYIDLYRMGLGSENVRMIKLWQLIYLFGFSFFVLTVVLFVSFIIFENDLISILRGGI
jgi:putative ABC transport system permease protein